jgi:hypothetical protein
MVPSPWQSRHGRRSSRAPGSASPRDRHSTSPSSEIDDAVSVLAVAMLFIWDCHVFPKDGPVFVTSHDDWNAFVTFRDLDRTITSAFAH